MIDLHLHLDGSLNIFACIYLAEKYDIELGDDFPMNLFVPADCPSLEEYLTRFELPLKLMQNKTSLSLLTKTLVLHLKELGFIYAEIRFAPQLHTNEGLTQREVVQAVLNGMEEGLKECPDFDANLILCCMRHAPMEVNKETIEVANEFKGARVVAVDLAGAEKLHPCSYYKEVFDLAKEYGLNITIHAGEATGSDEIMMALDNGAKRIGHGVHLSLDKDTIARVKKENICFEFCPTSNLQTKSLLSYEDVPLRKFMDNGIDVTINADNMTVSNVNAIMEMRQMVETFNLSKEEVNGLLLNSINHSFADEETKERLKEKLADRIDEFYENLKQ